MIEIMAIVLSGGRSSRMGRDKALLEINGETLLWKICRNALQVTDSVYVVARSQEQYQQAIANSVDSLNRIYLVLDRQFEGALVGFWQGLEAIAALPQDLFPDWILLLACDLPNIQSDVLWAWASQLADLPENAIAYLPRHPESDSRKKYEPLCGFYRWQCQNSLTGFIDKGGRSFQKWLDSGLDNQEVIEIANVPVNMLLNCNTPDDLPDDLRGTSYLI